VSIIYRLAPADHWHGIIPTAPCPLRDPENDRFVHGARGLALFLPRMYSPLNRDTIVAIHTTPRHDDGCLALPTGIHEPTTRR